MAIIDGTIKAIIDTLAFCQCLCLYHTILKGFTHRGLSPHKFTLMPGIHNRVEAVHRTARLTCHVGQEKMKKPEDICKDFPDWPERWHVVKKDIAYGHGILDAMRPFVVYLISSGLKEKTIRNHMNNLWLLGGEIIRSVCMSDEYNIPPEENLRQIVDEDGGPFCSHLQSEYEERSYNTTCRKLHRFLKAKQ